MDIKKEVKLVWAPIRSIDGRSVIGKKKIKSISLLENNNAFIVNGEDIVSIPGILRFQDEHSSYPEIKRYFPVRDINNIIVSKKEIKSLTYLNPSKFIDEVIVNNSFTASLSELETFQSHHEDYPVYTKLRK